MVTLKESVDILTPYERLLAWADNFREEFVKWSPYHIECEMYDGGYDKGMRVRFREIVGGLDYNVTGKIEIERIITARRKEVHYDGRWAEEDLQTNALDHSRHASCHGWRLLHGH